MNRYRSHKLHMLRFTAAVSVLCMGTILGLTPPTVAQSSLATWTTHALPSIPGATSLSLSAVSGSSPTDVWVVGSYGLPIPGITPPISTIYSLVFHYDGITWTQIPTPVVAGIPPPYNALTAVRAFAPNDVWVAGLYNEMMPNGVSGGFPYAMHWDGTSWTSWTNFGANYLGTGAGVTGISGTPNDFWIVGYAVLTGASGVSAFATRWNGSSFSTYSVPAPISNNGGAFAAVDSISSGDVWAVGGSGSWAPPSPFNYTLIRRWNGTAWIAVSAPQPGTQHILRGVASLNANDVWAAGAYDNASLVTVPFFLRWNGSTWALAPAAGSGSGEDLATISATEIITTGYGGPWIWNGSTWTQEIVPGNYLNLYVRRFGRAGASVFAIANDVGAPTGPGPWIILERGFPNFVQPQALVRAPCLGVAPPGSLTPILSPTVGGSAIVEVGDPSGIAGLTPGGTFTSWICSGSPGPLAPCGPLILGAGYGGQPAELLVDVSPGVFGIIDSPKIWNGTAFPTWHSLSIPPLPGLAGFPFYTQAFFVDYAVVPPRVVLTEACDFVIGS